MDSTSTGKPAASSQLSLVELEMIDFFVQFARMLNFPKSLGEIYGLLYCSSNPLTFDEVVHRIESRDFSIPERPAKLCIECDMRAYCDANWRFRTTS